MSRFVFSDEGDYYGRRREEVLAAGIALNDQVERVAEMRRALPLGMRVPDYIFREGAPDLSQNDPSDFADVALADLFTGGPGTLIVDHLIFWALDGEPFGIGRIWGGGHQSTAPPNLQPGGFGLLVNEGNA